MTTSLPSPFGDGNRKEWGGRHREHLAKTRSQGKFPTQVKLEKHLKRDLTGENVWRQKSRSSRKTKNHV
jgi:hypothetical protein